MIGVHRPPPKILGPPLNLAPPPHQIKFFAQVSPPKNYFGLKFLGPPLKLGGLLSCTR